MTERILVVAAHPDDEVLGMGGTIARHAQLEQAEVSVLCVTDGSSSQYPGDSRLLKQKQEEAQKAAAVLGVRRYLQHDLPDMRLDSVAHVEINKLVEEAVESLRPSVVYTVHPDVNMDHRAVFRSVMVATRPRAGTPVRRVLSYAPMSSVEWTPPFDQSFTPTWFCDVTATLESKVAAFACYETEARPWPHPRSAEAIRAHAQACGSGVGRPAAEPFVLIRQLDF